MWIKGGNKYEIFYNHTDDDSFCCSEGYYSDDIDAFEDLGIGCGRQ